jgi:hypothetical protein
MIVRNLLLIAGTGTKSGKTSMACRIIESFPDLKIAAIKISPHIHAVTEGLVVISEREGYSIYEETNRDSSKDTSRMLNAGADKVFFAKLRDDHLPEVFNEILKLIPKEAPIICESPALRNYAEPGVFIIMTSTTINKHKNINHLMALPHLMFKLEELDDYDTIPVEFKDGEWFYSSK